MIQTLLIVAGGGAIGSALRFLVGIASVRLFGTGFPVGTVVVNLVGSFAMGVLAVVLADKTGTRHAPFLMTGVLGGFTTFSAFSLDAVRLYDVGHYELAAIYVVGTVVLGLMALMAGVAMAKGFLV